jgi:hypothetical protein
MAVIPDATPTNEKPSHHATLESGGVKLGLILIDGEGKRNPRAIARNPIQRTTLQTSSGETQYSDFSEPFKPIPQDNWSGGRGQDDFERDRSRYQDGKRALSWFDGQLLLGPQEYWATGHRKSVQSMPGDLDFERYTSTKRYFAQKFVAPTGGMTAARIYAWVRRVDYAAVTNTAAIFSHDAGNDAPDAILGASVSGAIVAGDISDHTWDSSLVEYNLVNTAALTGGTTYWVVFFSNLNFIDMGGNPTHSTGRTSQTGASGTWVNSDQDVYFRVTDAGVSAEWKFFEYKKALYAVTRPDDASGAKLYLNGDRGAADSNAGDLTQLVDATKSWTSNEWIGAVVIVTRGTGAEEPIPWRTVTSNGATTINCFPDWRVPHDTTTEYVIVGTDKWQEITGHGITAAVTDVLVSKDVIYFAQGDYLSTGSPVNMRRANFYNNGGTWTARYANDGNNKARFLAQTNHPEDGLQVWRGLNDEGTGEVAVSRANAQKWGANLSFGSDLELGNDRDDLITGIENYGSPETLWILMTGSIWRIVNDIPERIPVREMSSVRSEQNGRAHLVHGVYLYLSLLHSVERYFSNNLDDIGPSRDAGMPSDRQGPIAAMEGYPGMFFVSIDGEENNRSSILVWNQLGWHEMYRGQLPVTFGSSTRGKRIRNLHMQPIPGSAVDRLWFGEGEDIAYLNFPSDTFDPSEDANFRYTHEAHIITAWKYASLQDVEKLYKSLKIFAEGLVANNQYIEIDYQLDDSDLDSQWVTVSGVFDTSPIKEIDLSATNDVVGRRIRFRIRIYSNDNTLSPKIKATLLEALTRIATKFSYTMNFQVRDKGKDLNGADETYQTVEDFMVQLDALANAPTAATFRCIYSPFDNKTVIVDPNSLQPLKVIADDQENHSGNVVVVEI